MADTDIAQVIAGARVDARSLSEFVFKPAGFKVTRRLAPTIDTLQFYVDRFDATKATTDAYIATIPTIVNNAINNTAVEGGVLADTFVVVDGNQSQRDVNQKTPRRFNTLALAIADSKLKEGQFVETDSYADGTGAAYYQVTSSGTTDGGSVIALDNGKKLKAIFKNQRISINQFGAGITQTASVNSAAINKAAAFSALHGFILVGDGGTYEIDATILITGNCELDNVFLENTNIAIGTAVRFGTSAGSPTSHAFAKLPNVSGLTLKPSGKFGYGTAIEIANTNSCTIFVGRLRGFLNGLVCGGYNSGCAYNNIFIQQIYSCKINLRLTSQAVTGWCNQNNFFGGRLGCNPTDFTNENLEGTRQILLDDGGKGGGGADNNIFHNISVETSVYEYNIELRASASYNQFFNTRFEGDTRAVLINSSIPSGVIYNEFFGGFKMGGVKFDYLGTAQVGNNRYDTSGQTYDFSGNGFLLRNRTGNSEATPHLLGYSAAKTNFLSATREDTDWCYNLSAQGFLGKGYADAKPKVLLKFDTGEIQFSDGLTATKPAFLRYSSAGIYTDGNFNPTIGEAQTLGTATRRWKDIYSVSGVINTSDGREKTNPLPIDNAVLDAWAEVSLIAFKWLSSVESKGALARTHFGVIAQDINKAFKSKGLDAFDYGLLCYDKWGAKKASYTADGEVIEAAEKAGDRWGVRPEQCLYVEAAYQRRRMDRIEQRLLELEDR